MVDKFFKANHVSTLLFGVFLLAFYVADHPAKFPEMVVPWAEALRWIAGLLFGASVRDVFGKRSIDPGTLKGMQQDIENLEQSAQTFKG